MDPAVARVEDEFSIRGSYGRSLVDNVMIVSDSYQNAVSEVEMFFPLFSGKVSLYSCVLLRRVM